MADTKMFHKMLILKGTLMGNRLMVEEPLELKGTVIPNISASMATTTPTKVRAICRGNDKGIVVLSMSPDDGKPVVKSGSDEDELTERKPVAPAPKVEPIPTRPTKFEIGAYRKVLAAVDNIAKKFGLSTLILVGPSGYGKTSMAEALADMTGRTYTRINCAVVRDPEEWFGFREAREGSTTFEDTEFSQAIAKGNSVICLDEVNRLEPWLLNALFPLLDDSRCTTVHGKKFEVAPNTVFAMTINQGLQYTGTFSIDEAFSNRADLVVKVGPLSGSEERKVLANMGLEETPATAIVRIMTALRNKVSIDCSTRASKNVAKLVMAGMTMKDAFGYVIVNRIEDQGEAKSAIDIVNSNV